MSEQEARQADRADREPKHEAADPKVLLGHHLKKLKLPTILAEYEKQARQCAEQGIDHPRYLRPRLRAHEILIQDLLCHVFEDDPSTLRDHASRMYARLDIGKLPGLCPAEESRMSYETQESIVRIVEETACRAEERCTR